MIPPITPFILFLRNLYVSFAIKHFQQIEGLKFTLEEVTKLSYEIKVWCILNFPRRSYFLGEAIFGEKPFLGRSHLKQNLLLLPCKECSKSFSESGSLKTHLTLIQEKSHLLGKNVPNHFLRRSHSPVHCSVFTISQEKICCVI